MSDIKKIIGVTVGTTINPQMLRRGKADKVEGATEGNFAALDASGNLRDSEYSGKDIDELFGMIPDVEYALNTKGRVLPLAYFEYLPGKESLEAKYPATNSLGKYAWIGTPINELYYSEMNTWKKKTPSPNDTYLFENRIFFYKNGELIEVTYLRDINAVSESVIAALPIYNGEVEENTEVIENLPVTVDFSEGDQTITAPDGYLVKSAILQKPETLVPENIADGVTVLGVTGTHEGGGGVGEGYVTITFMNGDTVLFSRPVYIGDDCPDPVEQDRIEAPTKESTAQYEYTFSGWSTTNGGSASGTALKNITEDKTLYAAFSSEVKQYTISYYDDNTLIHTELVPYGGSGTYNLDNKEGYTFAGWTPEPTNITGDMSCHSVYVEATDFANASWSTIARVADAGNAASTYKLGDSKIVPITLPNEDTVDMKVVIAGFNHDDKADGTGKAGISIVTYYTMPTRVKHCTAQTPLPGDQSLLRAYCNNEVFNALPETLKPYIKEVVKTYHACVGSAVSTKECNDKCWLLSSTETGRYTDEKFKEGTVYEGYTKNKVYTFSFKYGTSTQVYNFYRTNIAADRYHYDINTKLDSCSGSSTTPFYRFGFCI